MISDRPLNANELSQFERIRHAQRTLVPTRKQLCCLLAAHSQRWMTMRTLMALMLISSLPLVSAAEGLIPFEMYVPDELPSCQFRTFAARAITTPREWDAFWRQARSHQSEDLSESCESPVPPRLDFSKYTLLVLALGQRPSGGYSALFQYVHENSSRVEVAALEVRPNGKDCIVTTSFTYPMIFALIPRTSKPVQIRVEYADLQCGEARGGKDIQQSADPRR